MQRRTGRQEHQRWMDTNHSSPSPGRLCQAPLLYSKKGNPSSCQLPAYGVDDGSSATRAISKRGESVLFSLPALCLVPGASVGLIGCLRIRDLVANHFPHPRPFHSCPWDQRSSALEPCVGTAPVRETAAELHVRDGGRTSSVSCTLLLPVLCSRKSLEGTTTISQKLTAKHKQGC